MKKIEFSYSREKLIKLLIPALELLLETENMEERREFLLNKIGNVPETKDEKYQYVSDEPVLKDIIKKQSHPFFTTVANADLSLSYILVVVNLIFGLSFLLTSSVYEGSFKKGFLILSLVFFFLIFLSFCFNMINKVSKKILKFDENHNALVKSAEEDYQRQVKKRKEIISCNISASVQNDKRHHAREIYYSNVNYWKKTVKDLNNGLKLNYECIDETLDFLPTRHRNIDSVSRLLTFLFEGRAEKLKDALNLLEDTIHKERILKIINKFL